MYTDIRWKVGETDMSKTKALRAAFPKTLPILAGFGFLGMSYGMYMTAAGFPFWMPLLISVVVFGGSLQFVMVTMLLSAFAPVPAFLMALMIQARHVFYGVSMLEKYKGTGLKKPYLLFGLIDETFSINSSVTLPPEVDRGWFYVFVTLLNHAYWVGGTVLGCVLGEAVPFNTEGIDFVMTAMFAVIFLEQWLKEKHHAASVIGVASSVACLVLFGADSFIIPTMLCMLVLLAAFRRPIGKAGDGI